MKRLLYPLLCAALLAAPACSSKKDDPTPPKATPVDPWAFKAQAGTFTITPKNATAYVLHGLELSVHPYDAYTMYTFRGLTPSGTGVIITFVFTPSASTTNGTVATSTSDASYTQASIVAVDQSGFGGLSTINNALAADYTGQLITGKLR